MFLFFYIALLDAIGRHSPPLMAGVIEEVLFIPLSRSDLVPASIRVCLCTHRYMREQPTTAFNVYLLDSAPDIATLKTVAAPQTVILTCSFTRHEFQAKNRNLLHMI